MRLMTFTAASMAEAMQAVRAKLGDDAVIVSTQRHRRGRGVRLTAAIDDGSVDERELVEMVEAGQDPLGSEDKIKEALDYHGVPKRITSSLMWSAAQSDAANVAHGLELGLAEIFKFDPLPILPKKPVMVIGPPGVGKTVSLAKLAARVKLAGSKAHVITTDTIKAGAIAQLAAFTRLLEQPLDNVDSPKDLREAMLAAEPGSRIFIDSPGTNPFNPSEMADLAKFLQAADIEPLLILAAGGDSMEMAETAEMFKPLKPKKVLFTRLDTARRLGSLLAAAYAGNLSCGLVSITPFVTNGVVEVDAGAMARLLLRNPAESQVSADLQRVSR